MWRLPQARFKEKGDDTTISQDDFKVFSATGFH